MTLSLEKAEKREMVEYKAKVAGNVDSKAEMSEVQSICGNIQHE